MNIHEVSIHYLSSQIFTVMSNLNAAFLSLSYPLFQMLYGEPHSLLTGRFQNKPLLLLGLELSICEDKVRLFYAIKCNKFYCNLTFCKLNTYLILTRTDPPFLPSRVCFHRGPKIKWGSLDKVQPTMCCAHAHLSLTTGFTSRTRIIFKYSCWSPRFASTKPSKHL